MVSQSILHLKIVNYGLKNLTNGYPRKILQAIVFNCSRPQLNCFLPVSQTVCYFEIHVDVKYGIILCTGKRIFIKKNSK